MSILLDVPRCSSMLLDARVPASCQLLLAIITTTVEGMSGVVVLGLYQGG